MTRAARPRSRSKWRAWLDADWASACLLHKIDCWLFRRVDSLNMDIVCAPKLGVELLITQAHEGLCFGLRPTRQSLFPSKWAVERERERVFFILIPAKQKPHRGSCLYTPRSLRIHHRLGLVWEIDRPRGGGIHQVSPTLRVSLLVSSVLLRFQIPCNPRHRIAGRLPVEIVMM
jgi:hypothetical protein